MQETRALGRGRGRHRTACARKERLVRLPLLPRARPRAVAPDRRDARRGAGVGARSCRRRAGARLRRGVGDRATDDARVLVDSPALADYAEAAVAALTGGTAQGRRELVHRRPARPPQRDRARRPRCCRSRPTGSPSSSASSPTARSRAAWPRTCSTSASREPKRPKQVVEERGLAQVSDAGELARGRRRGPRRARRRGRGLPRAATTRCEEEARLPLRPGHGGHRPQGQPPTRQPAARPAPRVVGGGAGGPSPRAVRSEAEPKLRMFEHGDGPLRRRRSVSPSGRCGRACRRCGRRSRRGSRR